MTVGLVIDFGGTEFVKQMQVQVVAHLLILHFPFPQFGRQLTHLLAVKYGTGFQVLGLVHVMEQVLVPGFGLLVKVDKAGESASQRQ